MTFTGKFYSPKCIVRNISKKAVRVIGVTTVQPGDTIDLYTHIDPKVSLTEDPILKGLEKPHGELYLEVVVKRSLEIIEIDLPQFHYSTVHPDNINASNSPSPGQIPSYVDGDRFEWIDASIVGANPPLDIVDGKITIPPASASTDGYLTKEDYASFTAALSKRAQKIWQYQDFVAPLGTSLNITAFENGTGLSFDGSYIIDDTATIVLTSDNTQPPTTTLSFPNNVLPGNRVSVSSHTGTTVILDQAPDASLNCRVYYLITLPADQPFPENYQEAPDFLRGAEYDNLDEYYVNRNSDESIYGTKTFEGSVVLNSNFQITSGAEDGYILTSDALGNAVWQDNTRAENVGTDGYGVFKQRVGTDLLQFKNINVGSDNLTIDDFIDDITIDVNVDNLRVALNDAESEPTGFPNRTDSVLSFDDSTRTLSVAPVGVSFEIFTDARRRIYFSSQTVTIPDEEGLWFIYFDSDGVLTYRKGFTLDLIIRYAYVSIIYWDATNKVAIYVADERHGIDMDGVTHAYLHQVNGAVYISGLGLNSLTVDGSGSLNEEAQFGIDSGLFFDEDIPISVVDGVPQNIAPYGDIPIFYREGPDGYWRSKDADGYNLIYSGTAGYTGASGRPPYNEWTGANWQLTEVTNNGFFFVHFVATNDFRTPIVGIQGSSEYTNISAARDAAAIELGQMSGLPFAEFVTLATVIYQTSASYTNIPKVRIRSTDDGHNFVDWRQVEYSGANDAQDHGLLTGLGDDDHTQYIIKTGNAIRNAITGKVDFSSGELRLPVSSDPSTDYTSAVQGDIAFNSTDGYVVFYDGVDWIQVGTGATGGGTGDVTDATNIGTDGYGFFAQKNGSILEFKNLVSESESLYLYEDGYNVYIGLSGNIPVNLDLDGYFYKSADQTITGHTTFNPSSSTDPAFTIAPDGYAPTTNVNDGSVSIIGGIQYNYDGTRGKWLSNERKFLTAGRNANSVSNAYIEIDQSVTSSDTGYRILRNGTITGIWAQTRNSETWTLEIRRNGVTAPILTLLISSSRGNEDTTVNIDVEQGDELQFYVNGTGIAKPVVGIELAWRVD